MLPDEGAQQNGVSTSSHTGLSANSLGLNTVMGGVAGVVGGVSDVGRKYLYDTPAADEGGGLVVFVTQQTSLVVSMSNFSKGVLRMLSAVIKVAYTASCTLCFCH